MKGIVYKESEGYYLYVDGRAIATTRPLINFDYIEFKLDEEQCEGLSDGDEVEIGMVNKLNLEKGLFEWSIRVDSNGYLTINKM